MVYKCRQNNYCFGNNLLLIVIANFSRSDASWIYFVVDIPKEGRFFELARHWTLWLCFRMLVEAQRNFWRLGTALPGYVPILMDFPTDVGADTMRMGFVVDVTKGCSVGNYIKMGTHLALPRLRKNPNTPR